MFKTLTRSVTAAATLAMLSACTTVGQFWHDRDM